jgi:hypothetical protein
MSYVVGSPFSCPSCNRQLTFRSVETAWLICSHCRELIEKQATAHQHYQLPPFPEDMAVIQIGTQGMMDILPFEVIGRLRLQFQDGYLNLWTLITQNDALSSLAESFGQYTFCKSTHIPALYDQLVGEDVGESIYVTPEYSFTIDHIQECIDWDREGELPAFENEMRYSKHYEMSTSDGDCAFVWRSKQSDAMMLVGRKYDFEHFNFTNLRPLNEWL